MFYSNKFEITQIIFEIKVTIYEKRDGDDVKIIYGDWNLKKRINTPNV